jgi:hypothetical protein
LPDVGPFKSEDDVFGAEQHLVSPKVERFGVERRTLGDQFAHGLLCVWSERHDQIDFVGGFQRFSRERGEEVGDFVEQDAPEWRDEHGSLVTADEDDGCIAVQALVGSTADPHLPYRRGRELDFDRHSATAAREEDATVNDLESARHRLLIAVLEDNRVTDDRRTSWVCHPRSINSGTPGVLRGNPLATFGELRI